MKLLLVKSLALQDVYKSFTSGLAKSWYTTLDIGATAVTVTTSTTAYSLADYNIDILEAVINVQSGDGSTDLQLNRISMEEYLKIPRKTQTGRSSQYAVRRDRDNIVVSLWPLPDNSTNILKLETVKYIEDVSFNQTADVSEIFIV